MQAIKNFITPSFERNIPKFFIYRAIYNFMLFLPVWMIFLQEDHGLSLTEATLLNSAFWLTMVITEVPTGAVADVLGRKLSQVIGMVLVTVSLILFGLAPNYSVLFFANALWAFAITFISGADLAFFYDTLRELGRADEYPKYRGWLSAIVLASIAISSALGGVIGAYNLKATFIVTAAMMVVGTIFALWLKEPPQETNPENGQKLTYRQTLQVAFGAIRASVPLRYTLAYSSLYLLIPGAIRVTFIQPHAIEIGLPIATLGFISLGMRAFQVLGASYANQTLKRTGEWTLMWLTPLVVLPGVLLMAGIRSWVGIALFGVTGFLTATTSPVVENILNRQTPSAVRATILSVDSLLFRLATAVLEPGVGVIADSYNLSFALIAATLFFGVILLFVLIGWRRVWVPQPSQELQYAPSQD